MSSTCVRWFLAGLGFLAASAIAQQKGEATFDAAIVREVRTLLDRAYAADRQPDFRAWCRDLGSEDAAVRAHAGACLHALLVTVDEDHRSGRTPQQRGMKLGGGPQGFGPELRNRVAEALDEADWSGNGEAAEGAATWLLRNAPRADERENAMKALMRIKTASVDALIREAVQNVHPTYRVLVLAMQTGAARGMKDLVPAITALRGHYHKDVREAADAAAVALGSTEPAPKTATDQLPASLVKRLQLAADLVAVPVPPAAKWSKVTLPAEPEQHRPEPFTMQGFLLEPAKGSRAVLLPWGSVWPLDREPKAEVATAELADYVKELLRLRERFDAADLDEQREIEGQLGIRKFSHSSGQKWHGSAAEVLVAAWSHARGDAAAAAKLVLPMLETVPDEREWFEYQLGEVAAELDEAMLTAFTMERDYPKALAMAQKLARPECAFWWHQDRAIALAEQLPRRMGEFRELKLPPVADWPAQKAKLSRREQVTFLIERLRLLNCMQMSNPGGIDYGADQYAEPMSKMDWEKPEAMTKVVNPFTELLAMDLQPEEMELLLPLLGSTDFILAFDLQRFLPQRPKSLHRLQWVAGTLFEAAAREDLIDPRRLQGSAGEAQKQVDELRAWCQRSAGKSTQDRLVGRLEAEKDPALWRKTFWSLHQLDPLRAAGAAVQLGKREPERMQDMARLLVLLDRREQVGEARAWQSSKDPELRFYGNVLVLAAGADKDGAALQDLLAGMADADTQRVHVAVPALLASGKPEAKAFLLGCLQGKGPVGFKPTLEFAQRLMRAGYAEAFTTLDAALAKPADNKLYGRGESDEPADERWLLYSISNWHDERFMPDDDKPESAAKARADLRTWLRSEWEAVQGGKPTTMKEGYLELPWGDLVEPGPGWVRRI